MKAKTAIATPARKSKKEIKQYPPRTSRAPRSGWPRAPRSAYVAAALLLAAVAICYANALANGFVFDDNGHVLEPKLLRSIWNIPRLIGESYRPLRDITYAIDFTLWGQRAFGFHLTNILIHAANTLIAFALLRRMTGRVAVAAFAALVFAIHPLQADSVTYISGRRDVLFTFFYLASFMSYLAYRRKVDEGEPSSKRLLYFGLFLALWALSLMAKEMAATVPLFIFLWNFCDAWGERPGPWASRLWRSTAKAFSRDRWLYIILAAAGPVYVWYSVFFKGGSVRARAGFDYWGGSFYTNALTVIRVHAWYLKQLVWPTPVVQYEGAFDISTTIADWRVILATVVVGSTIAAGFWLLNRDRLMAFAILSYFALLLPVSHIIPHHELLADHYLYLPLMSFGLFVALLVEKLAARGERVKRVAYAAAAVAVVALAVMTILRNTVYKDDFTLWQANYSEAPNSLRAVSSLAGQLAKRNPAKAGELYERAVAIEPSFAPAYVSLAVLYQRKEKARELEQLIEKGLALPDGEIKTPGYENPRRFRSEMKTALALAKGNQGDQKSAERLLLEAIELYPINPQPYVLLASYYHDTDRAKELEVFKRQMAADPSAYDPLRALSSRLADDGKYDEAIPYLEKILALVPNDFYAHYELGKIYRLKQDCGRARGYLSGAQSVTSDAEEAKAAREALTKLEDQCGRQ